jgi:hypothetical protein
LRGFGIKDLKVDEKAQRIIESSLGSEEIFI